MESAKILIVTQEFPPDVGGCGVVAKSIANYLSEKQVQVTVLTSSDEVLLDKSQEAYRIDRVKRVPKIFPLVFMARLLRYDLKAFDAIFINDVGAAFVSSLFLPKKYQQKCVVYLQGGELNIFYKLKNKFRVLNFFGFKQKYIQLLKRSKQIVAVSECMKQEFISVSGLTELQSKISIAMPAINMEIFYPESSDLREKYQLPLESELILSAGRIDAHKGYQKQYEIFKQLAEQDSAFHWLIVGVGPYEETLKEAIKKDGLEKRITFVGRVAQNELRKFYSLADVFWQLSLWEALGLVYLEANACGTPVIGFRNSGVQEIVAHHKSGFLIENEFESLEIFLERKYKKFEANNLIAHVKAHNEKQSQLLKLLKN